MPSVKELANQYKKQLAIAGAVLLALAVSFTAGRYSAPERIKIVEKEKIVEVKVEVEKEKKVIDEKAVREAVAKVDKEWKKKLHTRTITKTLYDKGVKVEQISWTESTLDASSQDTSTSFEVTTVTSTVTQEKEKVVQEIKTVEKEKLVEKESKKPRFQVGAGVGFQWDEPLVLSPKDLTYEAHADVRIVGGLWLGVTTVPQLKFAGLTATLEF